MSIFLVCLANMFAALSVTNTLVVLPLSPEIASTTYENNEIIMSCLFVIKMDENILQILRITRYGSELLEVQ